jgi:hypothetical protein
MQGFGAQDFGGHVLLHNIPTQDSFTKRIVHCRCNCKSSSSGAQYVTLEIKKSEHASLAQQNGFGTAFFHSLLRLAKHIAKPKEKSVINMI